MSYLDQMRQASFRGVPFFVQASDSPVLGRRLVAHVYPDHDVVEYEDNGAAEKSFSMSAFLVGPDYMEQRKRFEDALNEKGRGLLVHPYRQNMYVRVMPSNGNESLDNGGMIIYQLTFVVDGELDTSQLKRGSVSKITETKSQGFEQAGRDYKQAFSVKDKIINEVYRAQDAADKALSAIDNAKEIANTGLAFRRNLENAKGRIEALALSAEYCVDTFAFLIDYGTDPETVSSFGVTASNGIQNLIEANSLFLQLKQNEQNNDYERGSIAHSMVVYQMCACALSQAGISRAAEFSSVEEAEAYRLQIFKNIDYLINLDTITDEMIGYLRQMEADVLDLFNERVLTLPSLVQFESMTAYTSLTLLNMLYGTFEEEELFLRENGICHPGFIPAAIPLKIRVYRE